MDDVPINATRWRRRALVAVRRVARGPCQVGEGPRNVAGMGDDTTRQDPPGADPAGARERLSEARSEAVGRLRSLRGDLAGLADAQRDTATDDEHDPEGATLAFERAQADSLARSALAQIAELDAALARVAEGAYGWCEVCGEPIGAARLEARPAARTCIRCAARSGPGRGRRG